MYAYLPNDEKAAIVASITAAELLTSGEIRVHIERKCAEDVMDHAAHIFAELGMHKTAARNGVLIYVSVEDHKFAIIGDAGINKLVDPEFWDSVKEDMLLEFRQGHLSGAICKGAHRAGEKLAAYFPLDHDDRNELNNEISFGK